MKINEIIKEEEDVLLKAANDLFHDYLTDKELTAFTGIDFDKIHEFK